MNLGILLELAEDLRPVQTLTGAGVGWINRFPPGRSVALIYELGHWNLGKIRVAEEFGPIKERPPKCFHRQVRGLRRSGWKLGKIIAFENVQQLQKNSPAR